MALGELRKNARINAIITAAELVRIKLIIVMVY
jgi:hypothetical protein